MPRTATLIFLLCLACLFAGTSCTSGGRFECRTDADCPSDQECGLFGTCGPCRTSDACPAGTICVDGWLGGVCEPGCRSNAECQRDEVCQGTDGCVRGCRSSDDCSAGHVCHGIKCVPGCRSDSECGAELCVNDRCSARCTSDRDCVAGSLCELAATPCSSQEGCTCFDCVAEFRDFQARPKSSGLDFSGLALLHCSGAIDLQTGTPLPRASASDAGPDRAEDAAAYDAAGDG